MFLVYHRQPTSVRALKPLSLCSCPLHSPTHFSQTLGGFFRFQGFFGVFLPPLCRHYILAVPSAWNTLCLIVLLEDCSQRIPSFSTYAAAAAAAKSLQSCPTLCDPIDGSPPGSPVPGILQVRTLEWVAISFSSA